MPVISLGKTGTRHVSIDAIPNGAGVPRILPVLPSAGAYRYPREATTAAFFMKG